MKLGSYVIMIVTMIVFLELIGIPTTLSTTLNFFGVNINNNSQLVSADLGNSGFWFNIFGAGVGVLVVLSATGAVIVGLFAKSYDTSLIILPIIIAVAGTLISTFWSIMIIAQNTGQSWLINLVATIFIGLGIGFIFSCLDYFAGR